MPILAIWMIKSCCHSRTHQWIISIFTASTAPHIIDQNLANKRKALRTRIPSLIHNYKMATPFLAFFTLSSKISSLTCCSDCHACVFFYSMHGSILILDTLDTCSKKILCCHVYSFLIGTNTTVCIYLRIEYRLSILIICTS